MLALRTGEPGGKKDANFAKSLAFSCAAAHAILDLRNRNPVLEKAPISEKYFAFLSLLDNLEKIQVIKHWPQGPL